MDHHFPELGRKASSLLTFILVVCGLLTHMAAAQSVPELPAIAEQQPVPETPPISEADIFNWWDEGIITPEQANEMLLMLEEDNQSELCLMAEVYAQESCDASDTVDAREDKEKRDGQKQAQKKRTKETNLRPHGFILWKGILDSTGHLQSHREELQISFYRYRLRLGSQNLLSYKAENYQAHLGQISTREIQSQIPLDTLWGTSLDFPLRKFHLGGVLDTQWTSQVRAGYRFNRQYNLDAAIWSTKSAALQTTFPFGKVAAWWQQDQPEPLWRVQLRGDEKSTSQKFSWRTTAYIHSDSVPALAHLSSTILNSRLWGSQTVSLRLPELANTKVTAAARLINPLHSDSISARFKLDVQSGPQWLRAQSSVTCVEASENCGRTDWKAGVQSELLSHWLLGGSTKIRYIRDEGLGNPRIECSFGYRENAGNLVRIILIAPDGNPYSKFQLKNEVHLNGDFLGFALSTTFNANRETSLHPYHASIVGKVMF